MSGRNITRSEFLQEGCCLAAAAALGTFLNEAKAGDTQSDAGPALPCQGPARGQDRPLAVRPYQLLCLVCSLGQHEAGPNDSRLKRLLAKIRKNPEMPISLQCNAGIAFAYQNPGMTEDTDESPEFNQKRDLTILQRLDMPPGETLPARILIHRLLKSITTVAGICSYGKETSDAWKGCPRAKSGYYEQGCKKAAEVLFLARSEEEMVRDKQESLKAMREVDVVPIRPHLIGCSICQYGSGLRPPFRDDNLPELLATVLTDRPDLRVKLVSGADWAICGPCPHRNPQLGWCVIGQIKAGGLYNELKDLNVLQSLSLTYGTVMKARDLYRLFLEKIPTVVGVCALDKDNKSPFSVWRDGCGSSPEAAQRGYVKGRDALVAKLK